MSHGPRGGKFIPPHHVLIWLGLTIVGWTVIGCLLWGCKILFGL